ncbi:hypothetical protein DID88_003845 [Monilinia fructigena]|uniref:Origin recognition complex subunit 3 winged helix C-terminal domain-containing protein n=1 Tax=Monilinia fructigena TaxID=38457 RepID=A0A395IU89_9HELO|nr:hypothetical protein DID88_003845 [Monilinia fructigena]
MSINGDTTSLAGFDGTEHQAVYIYTPTSASSAGLLQRPKKRRKVGKTPSKVPGLNGDAETFKLAPLLDEKESPEVSRLRLSLFDEYWVETETQIKSILSEANEDTLVEVTSFVENEKVTDKVPAGFIVTGPNIASQGLLFEHISTRLSNEINAPVVTLRSGESPNLKGLLKKLIRDITHHKSNDEGEDDNYLEQDGRKLLNYDLEIVHGYIKAHGYDRLIVSFQDSEAFDSGLLGEAISLFNSWRDRIPFILLFGIATSVDLFQKRLSRAAARCLHGSQFDVGQTSATLETIFLKVIARSDAPIKLGPGILSSLMERQNDHVQSVQAFIGALKKVLRVMHVVVTSAAEAPERINLYMKASTGSLKNSEVVRSIVGSIKRASLHIFLEAVTSLKEAIEKGNTELNIKPWSDLEPEFYSEIVSIWEDASSLADLEGGRSIRSSYNKSLRTAVISQKVQISQEKSALTKQDKEFTTLVDRLIQAIQDFVDLAKLQDQFLSEIWLYDLKYPYQDAFTSKPRFVIERALSSPHEYLSCACCDPTKEGALMSHPPTAILYKLFLEAGNLINIFDLWSAFVANLGPEYDEGEGNERQALMLFYRGLADLKLLGMIKQSRKKTDHLTKLAWKGL